MRTVRLVAVSSLSVLLLSACGDAPVRAGAAATVGPVRITTTSLQRVVDRGLADEQAAQQLGADRAAFQRQVLSRMITGQLLDAAAQERDVTVSDGEVDARIAQFASQLGGREQLETQAAQSGIAPQDLRPFIRDLTLNDKLADALVADQQVPPAALAALYQQNIAQYDQVVARHILLKTAAEATSVLATVRKDPAQFAVIAEQRSLDEGSKVRGGELDPAGRGAYVPEFEKALFSAKPGQYGVVQTQFGFHVYNLLERRTTTLAQATPELRRQALAEPREAAIAGLLRETAAEEKVRISPRFGRWDAESVSVVEAGSPVSSPDAASGGAPGDPLQVPPEGAPQEGAPQEQAPQGQDQQQQAPQDGTQQQAPQDGTQQQAPQDGTQQQAPAAPAS
ncbi:MAG: PpiC-type peptidyl-prolyl cis-trans isomerase [Frankiales bacterium]|nr:PpiC-type peptidyl-prolyl cis-trans isomerase [Frankiales bacterium]